MSLFGVITPSQNAYPVLKSQMGYALCVFRGYALWYTNLPSTNLVEPLPHALLEVMHYKSDALREVLL